MVQDQCRMRGQKPKTIQHLVAGSEKLAPTDFEDRHDMVGMQGIV